MLCFQRATLLTNSGCGKREAHINWSMVTCKMAAPLKQCFGEIKNGSLLRTRADALFSFEPLGGFNPPIAQTKGPVKRKHLIPPPTRSVNLRNCESIFSDVPHLWRTALFTTIDPRGIFDLLVDISPTTEQGVPVIAPARAFV